MTALATEHFTLQTARASTVSEAGARSALFMSTVSSFVVALALVGSVTEIGPTFHLFALALMPVLFALGLLTHLRLSETAIEDAYYGRAQRVRTKIAEDFRSAFERVDLIVTPTSPTVAFGLGERTDDPLAMYLSDFCTVPMPLAGIPAISIPGGFGEHDLPVGIQLAGPAFSENRILEAAHALEGAIGFDGSPARG